MVDSDDWQGYATHLLENKVDIRVIQVLLGHRKLDTTARAYAANGPPPDIEPIVRQTLDMQVVEYGWLVS